MAYKNWYSPGSVHFTRRQVLWLLENLGTLKTGYWPPEASNYIDVPMGKKSSSRRASFTTPIEYATEIEERLEKCGIDGIMLEAVNCWGKSTQSLSRHLHFSERVIRKRCKKALFYITGRCRRWMFCPGRDGCKMCRTCRQKKTCIKPPENGISYSNFRYKNGRKS